MSQNGCSDSALSPGDLTTSLGNGGVNGQDGRASSLAAAVASVTRTNRGIAGQAGLVVGEMRDSASRENISSRRSAPLLTGSRLDGLRNRLLLKYVCVDYEFFNTPDQVFR